MAPRPGRVLISEEALRARIAELGQAIARDYAGRTPLLIGVLQGAFLFMADLVRATPVDLATDFIGVSSYGGGTTSTGEVRLVADVSAPVAGRHVIIVEDIVDTGFTLAFLREMLLARRPASLGVCVLCDKAERRRVPVPLDYVGFTVPDVYVVGYGFDFRGLYRNLPYIAALEDGPVVHRVIEP
jgi:hypoxanthine phosphoribosyltransferase